MKKIIFILTILFSCAGSLNAQQIIKLWPGKVPGEENPKHPAVLRDTLRKITRITNITDPLITVYKPAKINHAAIIISPGGGNKYLAIDIEGVEIANWFTKLGYTAFVLQYRVPLKLERALQDIQRAIRLVRDTAGQMGLDPALVGVIGFSAGGDLSARAATDFTRKTYAPVDKADSLSTRPDFALLLYPSALIVPDTHTLVPEVPVTAAMPPTFIFMAADDHYAPPFALGDALRDFKIPFEFHITAAGGHGYGLRKGNPAAEAWPPLAEKWLAKYILKK